MLEFLSRKKCLNLSMISSSYSFLFDFLSGLRRKSMFGTAGGVSSKINESSSNISLLNLSLRESESLPPLLSIPQSREELEVITMERMGDSETRMSSLLTDMLMYEGGLKQAWPARSAGEYWKYSMWDFRRQLRDFSVKEKPTQPLVCRQFSRQAAESDA